MRNILALFGFLTTAACTAAGSTARPVEDRPAAPPAAEREVSGGFGFPRAFPDLSMQLVDVHAYDNPRLGTRLTYARREPALRVDVFVFPMAPPRVEVPDSARQRLVRQMFEHGQAEIREYERRGRYAEVRFGQPAQLSLPSSVGQLDGWAVPIEMVMEGDPVRSQLYAFTLGNAFVKFRSSYPREAGPEIDSLVSRFVAAFLAGAARARPGEAATT